MNHSSIGHAGAHRHSNLARRSTPATALHRNLVLTHLRLGRVHRIEQSEQNYPHRLVLHALEIYLGANPYGRFLPSSSWLNTQSPARIAPDRDVSPARTTPAQISANFLTLPLP